MYIITTYIKLPKYAAINSLFYTLDYELSILKMFLLMPFS